MNKDIKYHSVSELVKLWEMSERTIRNYCATGKIPDAVLVGKTWKIPENATNPAKKKRFQETVLDIFLNEWKSKINEGMYGHLQIDFAYNSNRTEDNKLEYNDVVHMFELNTVNSNSYSVDNIVETANHFKCVDMCIKNAKYQLTENFVRQLLLTLKNGTKVSREDWYMSESYKTFSDSAKLLLNEYNTLEKHNLKDILLFHSKFEKENPLILEDRRIGRLLVFKECLKNNIKPFVIEHEISKDYYALLDSATDNIEELCDLCHKAQERFFVKCQNRVKII
ncbi:MAG: helix-turn-helix domain-containing protein [Clostridia bacterium]|nr:helix-turn-helix domain-containing protein [Clostridia bacterium]